VREVLAKYDAESSVFIVRAHYRSPLNYSDQHLDDARQSLTRLYTAAEGGAGRSPASGLNGRRRCVSTPAMNDDFIPGSGCLLFDLANEVNRSQSSSGPRCSNR